MSHWMYDNELINDTDCFGFVYMITNKITGKKYIGKKQCKTKRKMKPLKGKTRCRWIDKETDWRVYTGSSNDLNDDIAKYGEDKFIFEIVRFCESKSELAYYEAKLQFDHDVLLHHDKWYNGMINIRLSKIKKG